MKTSLLLATLTLMPALAEDWPKFLGINGNTTSPETGLIKSFPKSGPEILWSAKLESGFGGAAIVGDEVYLVDRIEKEKDMLLCLDFATGKEKWRFESPSEGEPSFPGSRSVPTVEDDAAYFLGTFGEIFRINRKTGKPDWKAKLGDRYPDAKPPHWGYAQCTLIMGDVLIVMPFGEETGIAGWDKKTGKELWKSKGIGNTHSSPTVMNFGGQEQVVLLTTGDNGGLHSYDPKTGKELWHSDLYANRIPITIPTQIDENRIFATGGYGGGSKMLSIKKSGDHYEIGELWSSKKGSQVHPPLLIDKHLYLLANENDNHKTSTRRRKGGLVCFDLDGKELWSTGEAPFMGRGGSLFADGMLIIQDGENGVLRLVEPSSKGYKELASANLFGSDLTSKKDLQFWSPLALSDGRLILRGQDKMFCVRMTRSE
ncbi:MAG: PQQ-like beta-propeller repeat protein [Akkermansiaceae bacterium]|jgi:outer membrane protein assembly factor BamB